MPESQSASSWRLRVPQWRISVHLVSSPKVTKVIRGLRPIRRAAGGPVSLLVGQRADVGVDDDGLHGDGSGHVAVALGVREGQELLQFLVRLEGVGGESSSERIGRVFLAASSSSTDRRGLIGG